MKLIFIKLQSLFQNRSFVVWLGIVFTYLLFHQVFEDILTKLLVIPLLSTCTSTYLNDIIVGLIAVGIILFFLPKFLIRYIPSVNIAIFIVLLTITYTYYRYTGISWKFTPFYVHSDIKYFDILYLIGFLNISLYTQFLRRPKVFYSYSKKSFLVDQPLQAGEKDLFGYEKYAEQIAEKLKVSRFENRAFSMSITGTWGSGKTSFFNLIKRKLDDKNFIFVEFIPGHSLKPEFISKDFFDSLQTAISSYHSTLPGQLKGYSKKLTEVSENPISKFLNGLLGLFTGDDSIPEYKEKIKTTFAQINKHIIIFIDDLDRLDTKEIIEVIRLIRNTANFPNTSFITSYDRNYIIEAIRELNEYKKEFFLEKIFQLEINLPHFERHALDHELLRILQEKMNEASYKQLEAQVFDYGDRQLSPLLQAFLGTSRDCTRFANSFLLHYELLEGEVNLPNLFLLELLRFKYPSVHSLLSKMQHRFLSSYGTSFEPHVYKLVKTTEPPKTTSEDYDIKVYMQTNATELAVPLNQIDLILNLLLAIFNERTLPWNTPEIDHLSVVYPKNFFRYFSFRLLQNDISESAFKEARKQNTEDFQKFIQEWADKNPVQLEKLFNNIVTYEDQEDYEKVLKAIFHMATLPAESGDIVNYSDLENLQAKLSNYDQKLTKSFYGNNQEQLQSFASSLFTNAKAPYLFESRFVAFLLNDNTLSNFPLTKIKLESIQATYFGNYLNGIDKMNNTVWTLYHRCKVKEVVPSVPNDDNSRSFLRTRKIEEANKHFIHFIRNIDLDGFLRYIIKSDDPLSPFSINKHTIHSEAVKSIFGTLQSFEEFLNELPINHSVHLVDFKEFLALLKEAEYKYIEFDWSSLNPPN